MSTVLPVEESNVWKQFVPTPKAKAVPLAGTVGKFVHRYFSYKVMPYDAGSISQESFVGAVVTPAETEQHVAPLHAACTFIGRYINIAKNNESTILISKIPMRLP
tara:strand:+ start:567 stop:881 length:315 start_codon:yes stop_codon:yes gene_type:complete